jgi:hypothetical protein
VQQEEETIASRDYVDGYTQGYDDALKRVEGSLDRVKRLERGYWILAALWACVGALIVGFVWIGVS